MTRLGAFAGVARAPFLVLPVALVAAGSAASAVDGRFSWLRSALALVGLAVLHAAVNALNEASDLEAGIDLRTERTRFSGGSGTLPAGHLSVRETRLFAGACIAVGASIGAGFLAVVGWRLLPVLALGAVCVAAYTAVLARAGLGEIAAGLGLGALPILGSSIVQDGLAGPATWAASLPAFLMTFDLLLLNEFPDEKADREGGRRNLVLILGRAGAARVWAAAAVATPASILAGVAGGALPGIAAAATLPSLLLARPLAWALRSPGTPVPTSALASNVAWNLATNATLAGALLGASFVSRPG